MSHRSTSPWRIVATLLCVWSLVALPIELPLHGGYALAQDKPATGAPNRRELVAVLDLEAVGASKVEVSATTDRLREELLRSGRFTMVDRSQMEAVLNEQALQQTGCTSQECAVQVGQVLGVRKIVTGRVTKLADDQWLVSAQMIDVETAQTLRAESLRHRGDFFDLMDVTIGQLAAKLADTAPTVAPTAAVTQTKSEGDKTVSLSVLDLADGAIGVTFDTRMSENVLAGFSFYNYSDEFLQITILNPHVGYATREGVSIMGKIGLAIGSATFDPGTSFETSGSGMGLIFIGGVRASLDRVIIDVAFRTISVEGLSQTDPYIAFGIAF